MSFLTKLDWRWATKTFDPAKALTTEQIHAVMNAIRMAPTSFGLQPFKICVLKSDDIKTKISEAAYHQPQITQAPLMIIFCSDSDLATRINDYVALSGEEHPERKESLERFKQTSSGALLGLTEEQRTAWAAKQAYIALGFGLAACMELELDSCPMEGFDANAVDSILELPSNLHAQAMLAIGYRSADPTTPKFRFPDEKLLFGIK